MCFFHVYIFLKYIALNVVVLFIILTYILFLFFPAPDVFSAGTPQVDHVIHDGTAAVGFPARTSSDAIPAGPYPDTITGGTPEVDHVIPAGTAAVGIPACTSSDATPSGPYADAITGGIPQLDHVINAGIGADAFTVDTAPDAISAGTSPGSIPACNPEDEFMSKGVDHALSCRNKESCSFVEETFPSTEDIVENRPDNNESVHVTSMAQDVVYCMFLN